MMSRMMLATVAGLIALTVVAVALAHDYKLGALEIDHPWARATAPMQKAGGAFLTVTNTGAAADRLVKVSSPAAGKVELHTMTMDGTVMRMREVETIDVPAGGKAELKPGGFHVMLIDLKAPLVAGQTAPLTLTFERAGSITVELAIEAVGAGPMHGGQHKH
jgi:copper(I)-binding protein